MAALLKIHVASTFFLQSDPKGTFLSNVMLVSQFERFGQKNGTYLLHYIWYFSGKSNNINNCYQCYVIYHRMNTDHGRCVYM